jgi:FkbM family methyltransferase
MFQGIKRFGAHLGAQLRSFQKFAHMVEVQQSQLEALRQQVAVLRKLASKGNELTEDLMARYMAQTSATLGQFPLKTVGDIWLPQDDLHFAQFLSGGDKKYQFEVLTEAIGHCRNFDTAIDIGAHVGLWSLHLSERFREVHAFEPHPLHACCFLLNVPAGGVTLTTCALADAPSRAELITRNHNSGDTYMKKSSAGSVIVRRLDDFKIEEVSFIKIDVQGAELDVLRGAARTIEKFRPVILAEDHPPSSELYGAGLRELSAFLAPYGYRSPENVGKKDLLFKAA